MTIKNELETLLAANPTRTAVPMAENTHRVSLEREKERERGRERGRGGERGRERVREREREREGRETESEVEREREENTLKFNARMKENTCTSTPQKENLSPDAG